MKLSSILVLRFSLVSNQICLHGKSQIQILHFVNVFLVTAEVCRGTLR
jgi:hypothetical protein